MMAKATGIMRNSPYRVALFTLWLMPILIIADWIQIVVHECLGHSLVCILNGGTVYGYGMVSLGCAYTISALGKASSLIHVLFLMNGSLTHSLTYRRCLPIGELCPILSRPAVCLHQAGQKPASTTASARQRLCIGSCCSSSVSYYLGTKTFCVK